MITWDSLNSKLNRFLDDANGQTFSERLRVDSWNWAQAMFCAHTPRQRVSTLEIDTGKRSAVLPVDFYAADSIYDSDREQWLYPLTRKPGDIMYTDEEVAEFWVWGENLYLQDEYQYDDDYLTLYYWAYWPEVVLEDEDKIYTPKWAELALLHLTTSSCMQPGEVFASDINQYKIRVDSGNPEHNPREKSARFHLWMYESLTDKFPPARTFDRR